MRKGLQAPLRYQSAARPALPPAPPRSHCSDDSLDDISTTSSADDFGLQPLPQPQQASPSPDRLRGRKEGSVQVAVRVRPLLPREIAASQRVCVQHPADDSIELLDTDKRFTFDHVFPQAATQSELYDKALQPWLDSFLQGFNVTVIAYGQTGSGKTYTMGNSMPSSEMVASHLFARAPSMQSSATAVSRPEAADQLKPDDGLIPRFLYQLFDRLNKAGKDEHNVSVSFLEIYGEEVHDLLQQSRQNNDSALESLQLREGRGGVYIQGLTEVKVASRVDAMEQMRVGSLRRITGRTEMNEHSSRSHAVYTIKVVRRVSQSGRDSPRQSKTFKGILQGSQQKTRRSSTDSGSDSGGSSPRGSSSSATVVSKLTFVDLAGSERLKKTLAEGNRMKEGIQINVGLLALGNVINALGDDRRRGAAHLHVPYRSSKLTRLLQDALGGNSRTLFIACVSPAGSNASETHNTLQYANRAKNIQNKAVKNIDSRSAELLHLKAFSSLLRRELIKAYFIHPEEIGSDSANAKVDSMMADPKVQGLLKKLEEIASLNVGRGYGAGSNNQVSVEIQRAFSSLAAQFPDVARMARVDVPETPDEFGDDADEISRDSVFSNGGESFGDTSEESDGESAVKMAPFSLHQLSRTLDIITITLELRELQRLEISHREEFGSRLSDLGRTLHRRNLIRTGLKKVLEKMETTNVSTEKSREVQKNMKHYAEKLKGVDEEIKELERQKTALEAMLAERVSRCRKDVQSKRERLLKLRQMTVSISGTTFVSPLDVIIRATELPERFGIKFLSETADYLVGEEKAMAIYLDENLEDIGFLSFIFTSDEMASSEALDLAEAITSRIVASVDKEDLNAMLSHEIRRRSALLQNIVQGWLASPDENSTEREYLAANEQRLKECDENIADLSAALKARPESLQSISAIVDSISSLSLAKGTMKRLIETMYSHMRVNIAISRETDDVDVEEPSSHRPRQPHPDADAAKRIEELKEEHDRDLADMLNLFIATGAPDSELNQAHADQLTQKCTAANAKIKALEETGEHMADQLKKREEEVSKLKGRICELEESLKASEVKRESIRLMDRCQEIWTELGVNAEDQASKFNDINELLLKKCAEELEALEAARAAIQERIDSTYDMVKLLEVAIDVDEPMDLQMLHSVAGKTLLEQEKHLLSWRKGLTDELWLRVNTRVAGLSRVLELVDDMKLEDVADFRHVPHEQLHGMSIEQVQTHFVKLQQFKEFKARAKPDELFLKQLLEGLVASSDKIIARECLQQDDVLLSSLLSEKAKRVAETEQLLSSIRSVSEEMKLSQEDVVSVLHALVGARAQDPDTENELGDEQVQAVASLIEQSGGRTDVSTRGIRLLAEARDCFVEIYDGRANAVSFLLSTLQEADALTQEVVGGSQTQHEPSLAKSQFSTGVEILEGENSSGPSVSKEYACHRDALVEGKKKLEELIQPIENSIRALLYSTNDEFMKYGIDTDEQRVGFLLGRQSGEETNATRDVLAKYISFASGQGDNDSSDSKLCSSPSAPAPASRQDSLLSEFDPFYNEFCAVYSASYGKQQLQRVKDSMAHVKIVRQTVESAQKRLQSLSKIMGLYSEINQYREKISEFEASASSRDRLFGNSLRLLEEERFRKTVAKRYPLRIAALKSEVQKWLQNDGGDYDLNILGQDMKNMLVDMMNTDTELMHLDLGVVGSSRQSARRNSKTSSMTPTLSSSSLSSVSSNNSNASASASVAPAASANQHQQQEHTGARPARTRSLSTLAPAAAKKRS